MLVIKMHNDDQIFAERWTRRKITTATSTTTTTTITTTLILPLWLLLRLLLVLPLLLLDCRLARLLTKFTTILINYGSTRFISVITTHIFLKRDSTWRCRMWSVFVWWFPQHLIFWMTSILGREQRGNNDFLWTLFSLLHSVRTQSNVIHIQLK